MPISALLGRSARLSIQRIAAPGAFLAVPAEGSREGAPTILLPGAEIPAGAEPGHELNVLVYLDSEGRPIATTRAPKLELDQVAFLRVTACTAFGAFVDWGLPKELLVPFAEQTKPVAVGQSHPFGLYVDSSGRLAGTMRVTEMLATQATGFELDDWVDGEAWRNTPEIGLFVIVQRKYVGLVPRSEPHALRRGDSARFRVSNLLEDGKMELSLRGHAHEEIAADSHKLLDVLGAPGAPRAGDRSSPEEIRRLFGLSKKAFKRAVGHLLKQRKIEIDAAGFVVVRGRR
jgi:predicted RNA-binding protein (virulence factor B family)